MKSRPQMSRRDFFSTTDIGIGILCSSPKRAFVQRLAWRHLGGNDLLHELRTVRVPHSPAQRRILNIAIKLKAIPRDIHFAPAPWHSWNKMTITPSFTFHQPFTLLKGRELCLSYRVVVHAGDANKADIASAWSDFSKTQPAGP